LALSDIQSQPTTVFQNPTLPDKQAKPRPNLLIMLALMVGFMLGIVAAFFAEFLYKVQSQS
jgi:uncharacterized protein involved in exopolysaccharide biosynthesis